MFVLTDAGDRYFMGLAEVDPERPAVIKRWLIDEERDVEGYAVDHAERSAIVVVNDGVYDAIPVVDLANGLTMELIDWKDGGVVSDITGSKSYHLSWSCDDRSAFASWEHPTRPAEVHEWPRGRGWTNVSADDDFRELVNPVETTFKSFDGLEIHSLLSHRRADRIGFLYDRPRCPGRGSSVSWGRPTSFDSRSSMPPPRLAH